MQEGDRSASGNDMTSLTCPRKRTTVARVTSTPTLPSVVLVNLGTPEEPTTPAVRRYLREFLSDRRVIEMSRLLWTPILEGIILRVRPKDSAAKYRTVWMEEGSPLMHYTRRQAELLSERLGLEVRVAMRYGSPSIESVLDELYAAGQRRVLIIPAYPQYSASTVATVNDMVARWIQNHRDQFELRMLRSFPTAPAYIEALAAALEAHWEQVGRPDFEAGERVLASFHSIPVAMHDAGDPYRSECEATTAALGERLGIPEGGLLTTYQSVFGRAEWLTPATIDTVEELGRAGLKRLDVICPGFMADCLETLEEIDQLNRETFVEAGGGEFHYVRWGNDLPGAIAALEEQARIGVAGWVPAEA